MSYNCKRYRNNHCTLGLFSLKPSVEDCASCDQYLGPDRGLGDKISKVIKVTGIEKAVKLVSKSRGCGCGKRRAKLNKAFPFKEGAD